MTNDIIYVSIARLFVWLGIVHNQNIHHSNKYFYSKSPDVQPLTSERNTN